MLLQRVLATLNPILTPFRWIKFEEKVEEGGERWSKPHVSTLSLHSLFELRTCLQTGTVLLDLDSGSLPQIIGEAGTTGAPESHGCVMPTLGLCSTHLILQKPGFGSDAPKTVSVPCRAPMGKRPSYECHPAMEQKEDGFSSVLRDTYCHGNLLLVRVNGSSFIFRKLALI